MGLRVDQSNKRNNEYEDRSMEIIQPEEHRKKRLVNKNKSFRVLWGSNKNSKIQVIGISHGGKERMEQKRHLKK